MAIAPDKQSIYPDKMPYGFEPVEKNLMNQIFEQAKNKLPFPLLDLRPLLVKARTQGPTYQRYDTHWTDEGAALAYQTIMDAVQNLVPARRILPPAYTFKPAAISGDLARMIALPELVSSVPVNRFDPNMLAVVNQPDLETTKANGWHVSAGPPGHGKALVLCDSYVMGTPMMALLANSFSETWFMNHFDGRSSCAFPNTVVAEYKPDIVLYIVAERMTPLVLEE